jgi:hypothetical protein|tara:strand:+ start:60 stop:191 length:132 start_codon:yes stop_codon:yes gene_type:complete
MPIVWKRTLHNFLRTVYDIAWGGAEGSLLNWEESNVKWEEHTG